MAAPPKTSSGAFPCFLRIALYIAADTRIWPALIFKVSMAANPDNPAVTEAESDEVAAVAGCTTIFLGALPTGIVATTDRESRFTTETSLEPSLVT